MSDLSHYNIPLQSGIGDLSRFNTKANNFSFALNAVLENRVGHGLILQNEMSNTCSVEFPPDYRVIGFKEIPEQHRTIYALVNIKTGGSQIGEALDCTFVDRTDKIVKGSCSTCQEFTSEELTSWEKLKETCYCQYYKIVDAKCLNFNIHYPVNIEYKITDCGVDIYFTDNLNERRFLYFDYTDINNTNSRLKLREDFNIILQPDSNKTCTCPDGYILDPITEKCTKVIQTSMEVCDGVTKIINGIEYCIVEDIVDANCPGCNCPTGYTLNTTTNQCVKTTTIPLVPSGTLRKACKVNGDSYTNFGILLYSSFNQNGSGTFAQYHINDNYWSNNNPINNSKGVLNRTALWACNPNGSQPTLYDPLSEYIGFIFPVDLPSTKTYYIGIAGDNAVRIRLDCKTIVDMDPNAIAAQTPGGTTADTFKYWHIYPIKIPAGHHVIELTGVNYELIAGFGAEIYDNTAQEIINSKNGTGLNIIFSTKDKVGQVLQVSKTFTGSCPDGSCLDVDSNGNLFCTQTQVTQVTCPPCTCPTGYTLDASTNKCKKITQTEMGSCSGSVEVINGKEYCVKTIIVDSICNDCPQPTITNELDCNKIKVQPNYDRACVDFTGFINGGALKEGTYQVLIARADQYGNPTTQYTPASQIMPLFEQTVKLETNNTTSKALNIHVSNISTQELYDYYNIVVARTIDQFTEFVLAATLPITQKDYVYTGLEPSPKILAPTEVLFARPYYELAKGITKANNYLFYTGVKEYKILNLQPVANKIKLYWETVALKEDAYRDPRNSYYFRTYQRDEVYALAIVFEYNNGRDACTCHIPGRPSKPTDLEVIDNADVLKALDCNETIRNRRWQVYNTANVLGGDYQYNEVCEIDKCWEYGEFAYWESTETYPNIPEIWGDLACKPIRHHKFPDSCVTHIHDGGPEDRPYTQNNYVFPIGVRVDHQSVIDALNNAVETGLITQKERDSITSYRIVRGNRVGNNSIAAKGLLFNMFKYNKFNTDYYFSNYAYNDLSDDDFLNGVSLATQRYTFHSPNTHFVNTSLGNILKIETEEFGKSDGYFTHSECQAKQKFISNFGHTLAFGLGLAAAISATGKKKCEVITYKAPDIEEPYKIKSSGKEPFPKVYGVLTLGSGTINTTNVPKTWSGTAEVPTVKVTHNNAVYTTYDPTTGLPVGNPAMASERQITTCTGQPYQIFNDPTSEVGILLAGVAGIAGIVTQRFFLGLIEMNKILDTIRELIPNYNYSIQYNSVGKYNNYTCVAEGNKLRKLDKTAYLNPIIQTIDEVSSDSTNPFTTIYVNNWNRESSVYLKTSTPLANPINKDNSKVSMSTMDFTVNDLNKHFNRKIASYYVSIKNNLLNQYGAICDINYIETNPCSFYLNKTYTACETKVFGGDTFINRFAIKRKMPFFLHTNCNMPNGTDIKYSDLVNVGEGNDSNNYTKKYGVKYWFNTPQPLFERISDLGLGVGLLSEITNDTIRSYDIQGNGHIRFYQNGFIHLYNYGIPYFLVESDINVSYRHAENNTDKDFYPHNTDLKTWLEEANTPISTDNTFYYNRTYSKQDLESTICKGCMLSTRDFACQSENYNRIIYSEPTSTENKNDNWLIFKANNYYDFPLTLGRLIAADGLENNKILVRLEKGSQMFPAYNTLLATEQNFQVGTGGMFKTSPEDIAVTTLGYAGAQHRDIKHTEFGHIWADSDRGQIFNLQHGGKGVDEISNTEKNWFRENLPFQIRKDFPTIILDDIDNNFYGIGLHYCFDKRFNRLLVTKLDYKVVDPQVVYDAENKRFIIPDPNAHTSTTCLPGYNYVNGQCIKITTTNATKVGNIDPLYVTAKQYKTYTIEGSYVYSTYNQNGTGTATRLNPANSFWTNPYFPKSTSYYNGPLNRCGFWGPDGNNPIGTWIGVTFPVNVPEDKTYYIGMAADNKARIRIGCIDIVSFDENAMAAQAGTDVQVTFKRWHIYPVALKKGLNYVTLEGYNEGSVGAFGAEIYDNTFDELNKATNYDDLNLIFSTKSLFNKTIDSFNYSCPNCVNPIEVTNSTGAKSIVCTTTDVKQPTIVDVNNPTVVSLNNPKYFCNKSWTYSYNFYTKEWVSYHSYKPNYYIEHIDTFESGFTQFNIQHNYMHNVSNKSYQVFYGKLEPFIVELITKQTFTNNILQNFQFNTDAIRYHNQYDEFYNQYQTFNKAIVYNTHQTTGVLNLIVNNQDVIDSTKYPKRSINGYDVLLTNSENMWRFNDIWDISAGNNLPLFLNSCNNAYKELNTKALDYRKAELNHTPIRQRMCKVRLINDKDSNHHLIINFAQTDAKTSIR